MAKEIRTTARPDFYASTPPIEALKVLISIAATSEYEDICLMHNDVSRAYFHAEAIRPVYVDFNDEDWSPGDENSCGKLNLSMYGTRDAATNWEAAYQKQMKAMQFEIGRASPCLFWIKERNIRTMVHGDDFFSVGRRRDVTWMKTKMEERFALKTTIVGNDEDMEKEVKVLNRKIKWEFQGLSYEADTRHVPDLLRGMNLEHVRPLGSPGARIDEKKNNLDA